MALTHDDQETRYTSAGVLKGVVIILALCLAGYIVGPPLYWHSLEALAASSSCPSCPPCDCSSSLPLISIPQDCAKHDPEVGEDTENNVAELLSEELRLREAEFTENQQRADMALLEAKKITSQYQKEADKCNSGMETCEEAREKAEVTLLAQKRLTSLWELRARQRGWKEGVDKSHAQS
ncbi:uncharacterized protein LOC141684085 isoform X2 [Apium graveolens]|uniref:uncharacterized protein LOC141684085 isoform X2 n=1 Tax=Apium graveolens TaxID=4045 RepID=UPI003D7B3805